MFRRVLLPLLFLANLAHAQDAVVMPDAGVSAPIVSEAIPAAPDASTEPAAKVAPVESVTPAPAASTAAVVPAESADSTAPKSEKKAKDKLDFNGRVRMGAAYDSSTLRNGSSDTTQKGLALALIEARLGARYDAYDWLSLTLEADFAGKPTLKDGFVRVESEGVRGQFGQFKMPVSAMAQESPWSLPIADRGIIQSILQDHVQMLGRRQGLIGRYRAPGKFRPELTLGIFQGLLGNSNTPLVPDFSLTKTVDSQNEVIRLGARFVGIDVGVVGERISTAVGMRIRHFWTAGLDAGADYEWSGQGLRFWVEAFTGTSWKTQAGGASQPQIKFGTSRAIVAWRLGGLRKGETYFEPYVMAGVFDPELDVHSDMIWEGALGVSGGMWKRLRATLQIGTAGSQYGVPEQVFVGNRLVERQNVQLHIGGGF